MNLRQLAQEIARREKGKSQVKIGDIREVIKILADIYYEELNSSPTWESDSLIQMYKSAKRKAKKK